ncbi:MAG TPA: hypothetical protein VKA51_13550 [Rubrobacteraceae bacterium]|nr:hypothetical protein [Rubrobacteraceae bacterium]
MIGKLFGKELNAALVLALSGTVVALVANGPGPVSLRRTVSGVLSNPVPRREPPAVGEAPVSAPLRAA